MSGRNAIHVPRGDLSTLPVSHRFLRSRHTICPHNYALLSPGRPPLPFFCNLAHPIRGAKLKAAAASSHSIHVRMPPAKKVATWSVTAPRHLNVVCSMLATFSLQNFKLASNFYKLYSERWATAQGHGWRPLHRGLLDGTILTSSADRRIGVGRGILR